MTQPKKRTPAKKPTPIVRPLKAAVQVIVIVDDGTSLQEMSTTVATIPAHEWAAWAPDALNQAAANVAAELEAQA